MLSKSVQDATLAKAQTNAIALLSPGMRYKLINDVTNANFKQIIAVSLKSSSYEGGRKLQSFVWCRDISINILKSNQPDESEDNQTPLVQLGHARGDDQLSSQQQTINFYKGFDSLVKQMLMLWNVKSCLHFQFTSFSGPSRLLIEIIRTHEFQGTYLLDSPAQLRLPVAPNNNTTVATTTVVNHSNPNNAGSEVQVVKSLPLIILRYSYDNQTGDSEGAERLYATEEEIQCGWSLLNFNSERLAETLLIQPCPEIQRHAIQVGGDSSSSFKLSFLLPVARRCSSSGLAVMQTCKLCISCKTFYGKFKCEHCRQARYCSEACQKNDWSTHAEICVALVGRKAKTKKESVFGPDDTTLQWERAVKRNPKKIVNKKIIDLSSKDIAKTIDALVGDNLKGDIINSVSLGLPVMVSFCGRWTTVVPERPVPKGVSINVDSADVLLIELVNTGASGSSSSSSKGEVIWLVFEGVVDNYSTADSRVVGYTINNIYVRKKGARPWQVKTAQDSSIPLYDIRDKSEERWQQVQRSNYEKKLKPGTLKELTEWSYVQGWIRAAMEVYSSGK